MDGRSERGARNRQAIVAAALAFVVEQDALPTTQQVAERAGVAPRSVFHHFASLDALFAEAAQTPAERWWALLAPPEPGFTLTQRLAAALAQRAALFEEMTGRSGGWLCAMSPAQTFSPNAFATVVTRCGGTCAAPSIRSSQT